uniref:Putative RNA-dependent RNA polymerase n=1 Tax=Rhizoctonia solani partitivirus virus 4 TaxID=2034994 RepID=A0A286SES5_9VIRU|nr:putative RNA-dependent RNA polymerase [Rhizoctonia solani partitivirus virus 4]
MEYLTAAFNRITSYFVGTKNLEFVGTYHHRPSHPPVNPSTLEAHQRVLFNSMKLYLNDFEIKYITQEHRRSEVSEDAVLADFFAGDIENHEIPFDEHVEQGLQAMTEALRPPNKCRPVHILDVKDRYPYKWHVNSEPPFSTDEYFLSNRKLFADFWDPVSQTFEKYVDPLDAMRRYGNKIVENLLPNVTPAKFGFQKSAIFSWTRRWHHIIKSGFTDLTGLESTAYLKDRFIFPMLLHTKTAIVKKDDPNKMRTIWGCSKPWIIADTMFYWEYLAYLKLNHGVSPMLWSYETFTGGWFRLNNELMNSLFRQSFVTLDWSRLDKRAYFTLIHKIMAGVRTYLDFENGYVPTQQYPRSSHQWDAYQAGRIENLWLWTLENLFKAPIVLPNGNMYIRKYAGIPSGLFITQLLDSWYNYTMIATILSAMGFDPRCCIIKVQGDDSIVRLAVLIPPAAHVEFLSRIEELALHYFNAVVSLTKSEVCNRLNGVEVLSYRNHNGIPHRDEIKMLAQFYHTKARNPQPEIAMAQAVGFAYASCGHHLRVYYCLRNLYEYYADQGYTANRAGLALVFGNSPDLDLPHYDVDHFPTIQEIQRYFLCTEYRNQAQENKTWPLDYFLNPPCSRDDD